MAVTRCICFRRRFTELLKLSREEGWMTVADIGAATGCGTGCGGCRPYLAAMLATGHTCFAVKMDDLPPKPVPPEAWDL